MSISHKHAPLAIRELFAFTSEQQLHLMKTILEKGYASECIVIATCNRTEVYTYQEDGGRSKSFTGLQQVILEEAGAVDAENMVDYIRFYQGRKAVHHLFQVAAGLDSMVLGEDQILGQVKRAHEQAMQAHTSGVFLNTFFRYAVTGAKKVKTDTQLSKTSVSTGTLAIKAAEEVLGSLKGKRVMVLGGTGKIGSIVLKNLQSLKGVKVYSTLRNVAVIHRAEGTACDYIDYRERYAYAEECDVFISATASPHYTLTYDKLKEAFQTERERVYIDLAVPMDIEEKIASLPGARLFHMDDFTELAKENNTRKEAEARAADSILEDYELDFERWMIFQKSIPMIQQTKKQILAEAEKKGFEKALDKWFYQVREHAHPEELEQFFRCMEHSQEEE